MSIEIGSNGYRDEETTLAAAVAAAENEIREMDQQRILHFLPLQRKLNNLALNEESRRREADDRRAALSKARRDIERVSGQVSRLNALERTVLALRQVVQSQRRAIIAAYTKYAYNKNSTTRHQEREVDAANRLESLIQIITYSGAESETHAKDFEAAIGYQRSQTDKLRAQFESSMADFEASYTEVEAAEAAAQAEYDAGLEELKKVAEETEKLKDLYEEMKKMGDEEIRRLDKVADEVIRDSVNGIMARCEDELTDLERIKNEEWGPPVRINLIQFLSVEWESFSHPMRVSKQEKAGIMLYTLPKPFAKGTFRSAWYAKDSNGTEYIAKKFHASWRKELKDLMLRGKTDEGGREKDRESVGKVIQMNRVCQVALQAFDAALKNVGINFEMSFVDIWMAEETETGNVWFLEEPLPAFERYTNNADYADDSTDEGRLMGCCEHFTFEHFGRRFIVTDLQGYHEGTTFRLSDPALHILTDVQALAEIRHFMDGNRAMAGLADLLKKHNCNSYCNALRLPPLPKYTDFFPSAGTGSGTGSGTASR